MTDTEAVTRTTHFTFKPAVCVNGDIIDEL